MQHVPKKDRDNFKLTTIDEIEKGQYVSYYTKPLTYQDGTQVKGGYRRGGYVSFVNRDDPEKQFFVGFKNYNKTWSAQAVNVLHWYVSTVQKQRLDSVKD